MSLQTQPYTAIKLEPFETAEDAVTESVPVGASLTIARGTLLGIKTADGKWYVYASGNSDGTQVPRGIAQYDFTTDGSGNVSIANDTNVAYNTAPIYLAGTFRTTELTGLDAAAITAGLGRIVAGSVSDGVLRIG